jgi:AraC-like DNA-binding protein
MTEATIRRTALLAWEAALAPQPPTAAPESRPVQAHAVASHAGREADMPLADFVRAIQAMAADSDRPALGWQVGLGTDPAVLCEVGDAALAARGLGGALRRIVDYFSLIQDAADVRLDCGTERATLSYRIVDPDIWPREEDALFTLGIFAGLMRRAPGIAWTEAELLLEADGAALRAASRTIGGKVGFGAETNQICFPSSWLDLPNPCARPCGTSHVVLNRQVAQRRRRLPVAMRVRHSIFQSLHDGACQQDDIACVLGMSSRTLRRRLAEEGVSFQSLLDGCRMRLAALEFRVRPQATIAETALRLGYSEHSTFTRAFQRWNGMPPQAYLLEQPAA